MTTTTLSPLPELTLRRALFSWYLTKYMSSEVLFGFFAGTSLFLVIMLMMQGIQLMEFVVIHQVALPEVGRLSLYLTLISLPLTMPIAFLFAVLMGVSRANSEGEILALQVNGMSLKQVFSPIGVFSVLLASLCLYMSLWMAPQCNRQFELLIAKLTNDRVISTLKPGVFIDGFYGLVLYTEHIVPMKNEMRRVFLYDRREEEHPLAITAAAGLLKSQAEKGLLTLRLTNGSIHLENTSTDEEDVQQKIDFDVYDINLELSRPSEVWRSYSPPSYGIGQLLQKITESEHDLPQHRQLQVEFHRRFSMAFSCIVFAVLGFGIALLSQRGIRSAAIVFCLSVITIYWLAYVGSNAMAIAGWVPPWLGVWAPNAVFLALGYGCYRRYVGG